MRRYTLSISRTAKDQISAQVDYIAEDSIDNALAWERRLRAALDRIADAPGHVIDETLSAASSMQLRRVSFERTYIIHYRIIEVPGIVEIVNFRHGARRPGLG